MGSKYRSYRYKMKAKYYDPYSTDEERLSNCPPDVSQDDWRWLVHYWGTPEVQVRVLQMLHVDTLPVSCF